jgi:LmbE family N-acetylglucosaminyl deacetylase
MPSYRHVYLSPHLDDVVLSCGGRIHQLALAGEPVLVVTVFAGSPRLSDEAIAEARSDYIAALHRRWETEADAATVRRAEDLAALGVLGADSHHLPYLDCIYRQHPVTSEFLYQSDEDIFAEVHPVEFSLAAELEKVLTALVGGPGVATVYAPLTAGHHVDHQFVVAAALGLQASGHRVAFYEDYPYAEEPSALAAARQWVGGTNWRQESFLLSARDLTAKTNAVLCYRSQLSTFFDDDEQVAQRLRAYATSVCRDPSAVGGVPTLRTDPSLEPRSEADSEATSPPQEPCERIWHLTK